MSRYCECDMIPTGQPSSHDSYEEGEARLPNPVCPVHRESDDLSVSEFDTVDTLETFGVAWSDERGAWFEADDIDEETGEPLMDGAPASVEA